MSITFELNKKPEELLALSNSGREMVKVDSNRYVKLTTNLNTLVHSFYAQEHYGMKAAISDDAHLVAFGSKFGTITLWALP